MENWRAGTGLLGPGCCFGRAFGASLSLHRRAHRRTLCSADFSRLAPSLCEVLAAQSTICGIGTLIARQNAHMPDAFPVEHPRRRARLRYVGAWRHVWCHAAGGAHTEQTFGLWCSGRSAGKRLLAKRPTFRAQPSAVHCPFVCARLLASWACSFQLPYLF